jgi:hypothetical protein
LWSVLKEAGVIRAVVVLSLISLLAASTATAAKPKPYAWTTTQATTQIRGANLDVFGSAHLGTLVISKCAGKGPAVAKRYLSFSCAATWTPRGIAQTPKKLTLFAKVRPVGKGQPCVALGTIPAACLARGARLTGTTGEARVALAKKLGADAGATIPYQGPMECASYGAGYFNCWFGANGEPTDPGMGHATVILAATPIINVTAMPSG